jgi:lipoprotein NlpD
MDNQKKANSKKFSYRQIACLLIISLSLVSCAKRSSPAPVIEVYQGNSILDFERNSYHQKKYIVKKGDTLFSIAWFSGNDYRDIARLNSITKPYHIYPGQQILLKKPAVKSTPGVKIAPGQTSKIKPNQTVDRPKKQAYGETNEDIKRPLERTAESQFPVRVAQWTWPANGNVGSQFSLKELGNKGIDISGSIGDDIVAAADGKVVYTGNALRGYGQLVIVKHSETFLSAYAHNDEILVKEREWVKAGQKIASMGNSGTDKVKLRFEVRYKGKSVDPLRYLPKL